MNAIADSIDQQHYERCIQKLISIDLGEAVNAMDRRNSWKLDPDYIILGLDNKAIICKNNWAGHIAEVASDIFDYKIEYVDFKRAGLVYQYFTTHGTLTIPERKALEALVQYFDRYYPGVEADSQEITFPKAMSAYGAPFAYANESDAYQAAEVLFEITRMKADVFNTDEGYTVVIHDECGDLTDYNFACVLGACRVLSDFSVQKKYKEQFDINDEEQGNEPWQKAIGERYTQQARLEAKIDRLLECVNARA